MIIIFEEGDHRSVKDVLSASKYANQILIIENEECTVVKNRDNNLYAGLNYSIMKIFLRYIKNYEFDEKDFIKLLLKK